MRKRNLKSRIAFNSYAVNSRGEVIPVTSINLFGASEGESRTNDRKAFASLKNIRQLRLL